MVSLELPATDGSVAVGRKAVERTARECGMGEADVADVCLVVSEGLTNAIVHGSLPGASIHLVAEVVDGDLVVEVTDSGPGRFAGRRSPGAGIGLGIISELSPRFDLERFGDGMRLRARFPCTTRVNPAGIPSR